MEKCWKQLALFNKQRVYVYQLSLNSLAFFFFVFSHANADVQYKSINFFFSLILLLVLLFLFSLLKELPSLEVEGSRYTNHPRVQKHSQRGIEQRVLTAGNTYEEREGETSGYASDSIEATVAPNDIKSL